MDQHPVAITGHYGLADFFAGSVFTQRAKINPVSHLRGLFVSDYRMVIAILCYSRTYTTTAHIAIMNASKIANQNQDSSLLSIIRSNRPSRTLRIISIMMIYCLESELFLSITSPTLLPVNAPIIPPIMAHGINPATAPKGPAAIPKPVPNFAPASAPAIRPLIVPVPSAFIVEPPCLRCCRQ